MALCMDLGVGMNAIEKEDELILLYGEIETDFASVMETIEQWISHNVFLKQKKMYLLRWQIIKNPTLFQEKRGFFIESESAEKYVKRFTLRTGDKAYFFSVKEVLIKNFNLHSLLENLFHGYLLFVDRNQNIEKVLIEIQTKLQRDIESIRDYVYLSYANSLNNGNSFLLGYKGEDDPVTGDSKLTFSIIGRTND